MTGTVIGGNAPTNFEICMRTALTISVGKNITLPWYINRAKSIQRTAATNIVAKKRKRIDVVVIKKIHVVVHVAARVQKTLTFAHVHGIYTYLFASGFYGRPTITLS
jgi:hypothetical protein